MEKGDVAIIGGGIMGATAAMEMARRGLDVTLIDQGRLPNPKAASVDHSKVFRFAYPDEIYVRMAAAALESWRALEREANVRLLTETGMLMLGERDDGFEGQCYETMRGLGFAVEVLDADEVSRRFPQFRRDELRYCVFDPSGAILHAERAVSAAFSEARRYGARIVEGERVVEVCRAGDGVELKMANGNRIHCARAVVAAGPWTRKLLAEIGASLWTTRQEVFYFDASFGDSPPPAERFAASNFPIFIALETGYYGFPIHHRGAIKIANHHKGEAIDPDEIDERISDASIEQCREFFRRYLPALAGARLVETRVCVYNNTPDDDFLIDRHPEMENVWLVTGFSGHGFKFGPLIGQIAASLLMDERPAFDLSRFRLQRFAR